jgi:hypothetical protein
LLLAAPAQAADVVYGPCPGYPEAVGCLDGDTIYVLERGDRYTLNHELGHVFDRDKLTDRDRRWFTRRLGYRKMRPWWGEQGKASPAERFADAYATCKEDGPQVARRHFTLTGYGYRMDGYSRRSIRHHRDVCNAITVLGMVR